MAIDGRTTAPGTFVSWHSGKYVMVGLPPGYGKRRHSNRRNVYVAGAIHFDDVGMGQVPDPPVHLVDENLLYLWNADFERQYLDRRKMDRLLQLALDVTVRR